MKGPAQDERVLDEWTERNLTAAVQEGNVPPAFEVDECLQRLGDIIASGRHPVLVGEGGVGKTAVIGELVRRSVAGEGPPRLAGRSVLQISLRARAASLRKPREDLRPEFQKLVRALVAAGDAVVPFFRDLHLAGSFNLESQVVNLAMRFPGVIIGEALMGPFEAMVEDEPDIDQHFTPVSLPEASLDTMERLLGQWAGAKAREQIRFHPHALTGALELTHRFLPRSRMPRKTVDFLEQVAAVTGAAREVTRDDVIERFHEAYRVPRMLIDPLVSFDPAAEERAFRTEIIEQGEAIKAVVRMMTLIRSGLSDPRRPFGAFLFAGPSGVGKTHVAQFLAEHLFGGRERLIRINMADYQDEKDGLTLFGTPNAYGISDRRGVLTARLLGHPFAVLLLDEFEKAHHVVHDRFLQLIDEGAFINGASETVSCRSLIIIAASNAGAEVYRNQPLGFGGPANAAALDQQLDRLLLKHFRMEFLNRFDQVVHFHPLTRQGIRTIALREIERLRERVGLRGRGLELEVDDLVLDWLSAHGYHPNFGARFLRRAIERHVTGAIAEVLVDDAAEGGRAVELTVRGGSVVARLVPERGPAEKTWQRVTVPEGRGTRVRAFDRKALVAEARTVLDRAGPRVAELEERRERAAALLARMGAPAFWDDRAGSQEVLNDYRKLDVIIQMESRFAEEVDALARALGDERADPRSLARQLEAAAAAVHEWEERLAEQGPGAVWLVLRNIDPLQPAGSWVEQLVAIELAWCRRLHLQADAVAFGALDEELARAVLFVEGPGAAAYLEMEEGVHRIRRSDGPDLRIRVDVVARGLGGPPGETAQPLARRTERFGVQGIIAVRLEQEESGAVFDLAGSDREALEALAADLKASGLLASEGRDVARTYGVGGVAARDPRTGAAVARLRDVLAGKLDVLLDAWRDRDRCAAATEPAPATS